MLQLATAISKSEIADNIYELVLKTALGKYTLRPGQFVHVRVSKSVEHVLRRPISISNIDKGNNEITITFRAEGPGTKKLAEIKEGETVDVLMPLGNGYNIESAKAGEHVLIVGGGIGVPPLYELSKQLHERGVKTTHVLGFNSRKDVFYEADFKAFGETYVATADGTYGTKGFVTDVIGEIGTGFDKFYACGPKVMLKVLDETMPMDGFISLEERMGCGFGVCYACVCDTKDGRQVKICTDGPVFEKGAVVL
ncbi:dihydroorotate dehydrogenase B (NAD(+)), electron transfer subunit [Jeotgalicoccus coquinae]|uniref:Dihydroorotate dehydrogenase B (NAD(+)), electron transfer subunit n=1 Tax=Jeotgalicoccus coquinae TaxID=709509 RepID=A0A6V7RK29_9STAP|nr:dihydroorotate dehydrogenase electron transfer subunit [Jeotgalicoccus coquinae]MBB6422551.1 dihydroorotate dehydrogenase electron transfer subunit [Jeotgalicoccus coquinae]GGE14971.1 dihydroorotate dehydrogenase B (NAD(+)), electron transfer subunit [Jeotgalicoccus coquinae]CAD2078125.1 Dihydroorotate dehydrogenase B (NAD(+)), electron transfer subunit [Jeotgalicoccus coquinae]